MNHTDQLRDRLPSYAKDLKLNLQAVLRGEKLGIEKAWGCAITAAAFINDADLLAAFIADAKAANVPEGIIEDAHAAAVLMGMTTTYYRFRDAMGSESPYAKLPPQLHMTRMAQVTSSKAAYELFSLVCAALAGCHMCMTAHERSLHDHQVSVDEIHDAIRIAGVVKGVSVALAIA